MKVALIYMVGGLSSRFGGKIKQLAKVGRNGETFIECSIIRAFNACSKIENCEINKIIFIVSEKTEKEFKEKFKNFYNGIPVIYALQHYDIKNRDKPWGTGDAVSCSVNYIEEPCIVCNGDDLYDESLFVKLFEHFKESKLVDASVGIRLIDMLPENGEVTRGIFIEKDGYLDSAIEVFNLSKKNYHEKKLSSFSIVNVNLFGLWPESIRKISEKVKLFKERNKYDREKECFIHFVLSDLVKEKKIKIRIYKSSKKWLGLTNPEDEVIVREELKKEDYKF